MLIAASIIEIIITLRIILLSTLRTSSNVNPIRKIPTNSSSKYKLFMTSKTSELLNDTTRVNVESIPTALRRKLSDSIALMCLTELLAASIPRESCKAIYSIPGLSLMSCTIFPIPILFLNSKKSCALRFTTIAPLSSALLIATANLCSSLYEAGFNPIINTFVCPLKIGFNSSYLFTIPSGCG